MHYWIGTQMWVFLGVQREDETSVFSGSYYCFSLSIDPIYQPLKVTQFQNWMFFIFYFLEKKTHKKQDSLEMQKTFTGEVSVGFMKDNNKKIN